MRTDTFIAWLQPGCIVLLALVVGIGIVVAQSQGVDQTALLTQLESGSWRARREAVSRLVAIRPEQRSPAVTAGVLREIERLQGTGDLGASEVPSGSDHATSWDYYTDVVYLACDSSDPVVIQPLVDNLEAGRPVIEALARFGYAAAPQLVAGIRSHNGGGYLIHGLIALRRMLERNPTLPAAWRSGVAEIVRQHLTGRQHSATVRLAIDVSVVLGDPEVNATLAALTKARAAGDVGLVLLDANTADSKSDPFVGVRAKAEGALSQIRSGRGR